MVAFEHFVVLEATVVDKQALVLLIALHLLFDLAKFPFFSLLHLSYFFLAGLQILLLKLMLLLVEHMTLE